MRWTKRLVITLPFVVAAVLNVLIVAVDRLHLYRQHVAGYGFLFATPWAWLLDGIFSSERLLTIVLRHQRWFGPAIFLWIPALLYSACLWVLFLGVERAFRRIRRAQVEK